MNITRIVLCQEYVQAVYKDCDGNIVELPNYDIHEYQGIRSVVHPPRLVKGTGKYADEFTQLARLIQIVPHENYTSAIVEYEDGTIGERPISTIKFKSPSITPNDRASV